MKYILLHSSKMLLAISLSIFGCEHDKDYVDLNKNSKKDIYENPLIPAIDRAKDLISHLTVEEKIAQLESGAPSIPRLGVSKYNWMN